MDRNQGRRLSAEEKLGGGGGEGEAIRGYDRRGIWRHQVGHIQFYRWERLASVWLLMSKVNKVLLCW